jgi:hypothetical protein
MTDMGEALAKFFDSDQEILPKIPWKPVHIAADHRQRSTTRHELACPNHTRRGTGTQPPEHEPC